MSYVLYELKQIPSELPKVIYFTDFVRFCIVLTILISMVVFS